MAAITPAKPASLVYRLTSAVERLDLAAMYPVTQPFEVELGAGDGSFLAQYAKVHPERNFLGIERLLGRLRKLDKKGMRGGLTNLRLLRMEAAYLAEYLLPLASVDCIHIYFPDPWPKRRHWKNRLINTHFTQLAARILSAGGTVYLRTDNAEYFAQMTEVFGANSQFASVETPVELSAVITDFERQFNSQGIATRRAAYRKRD